MISAIVLSIILHAQAVVPVLGSTQGTTGGAPPAPSFRPVVLEIGNPLVLSPGIPVVIR